MEFRTKIEIRCTELFINHQSKLMLLGSCFAENIGNLLQESKFDVNVNPFGILYNPASVSMVLHRIFDCEPFLAEDLIYNEGLYHSFFHHGVFSNADKDKCLSGINESLKAASEDLHKTNTLLITFGTSYVFRNVASANIVANCHKLPALSFDQYRLSVADIVNDWSLLIEKLRTNNPNLNILFTVSPIRHWKDGAHENQLSKAILLLAIDELQKKFAQVYYFPSYELLLDELRDYRFYAEDMIHPSDVAVKYIWETFGENFFNDETKQIIKEWNSIKSAINHKPFNSETEIHKQFLRQTLLRIEFFRQKYTYIRIENEKAALEERLNR